MRGSDFRGEVQCFFIVVEYDFWRPYASSWLRFNFLSSYSILFFGTNHLKNLFIYPEKLRNFYFFFFIKFNNQKPFFCLHYVVWPWMGIFISLEKEKEIWRMKLKKMINLIKKRLISHRCLLRQKTGMWANVALKFKTRALGYHVFKRTVSSKLGSTRISQMMHSTTQFDNNNNNKNPAISHSTASLFWVFWFLPTRQRPYQRKIVCLLLKLIFREQKFSSSGPRMSSLYK